MKVEVYSSKSCGPCKVFKIYEVPKLEEAGISVVVHDIDTDAGRELAMSNRVRAVPTINVFKGDGFIRSFVGMTKASEIIDVLGV